MKRIITISVFAILSLLRLNAQSSVWEELTTGTQKNIRDLYFVNSSVGFAVGDDSLFLRTGDGGDTWTQMAFPDSGNYIGNDGDMKCVSFFSQNDGVIGYRFGPDLIATSDGGTSWDEMVSMAQTICEPRSMILPGINEGYVVGRGCFGGAYISQYAGFGWNSAVLVYYGPNQGGLNDVDKDNTNNVVITVGDDGLVIRSTDMSFASFDTIVIQDTSRLTGVSYAGSNTWYISGSDLFEDILISTDGGQTFSPDSTYPITFFYPEINDLQFVHPNFGVAAGIANSTAGIILIKNGSGWTFESFQQPLNTVHAVDSNLVFVAGDGGKIYRYKNILGLGGDISGNSGFDIFPNPSSAGQMITVRFENPTSLLNWQLLDVGGRIILNQSLNQTEATQQTLMLPSIQSGIYWLRLNTKEGGRVEKLVIR